MFHLPKPARELMKLGEGQFGLVHHAVGRIELRVLRQMADLDRPGDGDRAGIDRHLADQHLEKGGFARAVVADQSDALAQVDAEIEIVEKDSFAEGLFDSAERGDRHGTTRGSDVPAAS